MPKFNLFFQSNRLPPTFEDGEKELAALKVWSESFEKYVVNPGSVLKQSLMVTKDEVKQVTPGEVLSAYAEIEAINKDEAVAVAKSWPILENGFVMISEVVDFETE
ncbi:hypothetical protein [uncultured Cohaesibacter sp.]|uniref:hypothetical protein n=1 Tax=uncultured Cohaesibacter sp. TaxID=1002546 RepID=UPI0029C99F02|nr:hypothetical protein [uncultured Cohaesibacter sp.]